MLSWVIFVVRQKYSSSSPLGEPSVYVAWRAQYLRRLARAQYLRRLARVQYLSRLAGPVFIPLGGPSVYAAWRAPVFTPLGGASVYVAWRVQCLRRLAGPVFSPLGGPSVYAAWWAQCFRRLAGPVFAPLRFFRWLTIKDAIRVSCVWFAECLMKGLTGLSGFLRGAFQQILPVVATMLSQWLNA